MDETEAAEQIVVCDAGPLIHLDELGCLELLSSFSQVWIPSAVWKEIERHRPFALTDSRVRLSLAAIDTFSPEVASIARLLSLHQGELEAIQFAKQINADILLTDDSAARLAATQMAIRVHGTIGVLLRSIRLGQKTKGEVVTVLRELPTISTLHVRQSLLDEIIGQVERQ
jgi:predicted nucleic acid-binding protein